MKNFILLNQQGKVVITPSGSLALDVTIQGTTYTEAFDTNVATTIDNWMTSYKSTVASVHNVYAVDSTTTLDLYYVKDKGVSSANATSVVETDLNKLMYGVEYIVQIALATATTITITLDTTVIGADVITLTFLEEQYTQAAYTDILNYLSSNVGRSTGSFEVKQANLAAAA